MEGRYTLAAALQETALSEFQTLAKHAVFPILAELEGPDATKWRPIIVTEAEPDKANAVCTVLVISGVFQDNPELIDLVSMVTLANILDVRPCPDPTLPSTALFERHVDEDIDVDPTRIEFDIPEAAKPAPKTVITVLPLDGALVTEVEDTAPGTTIETLNDPRPTPTDALTTNSRTGPNPEATLNAKELSETQVDLLGADPRSLVLGEALIPKNLPNTERLVLPDEGTKLLIQTLETSGAL